MIKKPKPETIFIISGDYNQFPPVTDRILPNYNYSRNPAIYELCNFNKILCRRADDTLFNIIKFDNIPNLTPQHFNISSNITDFNIHLSYTNKKRINIMILCCNIKRLIIKDHPLHLIN